MARLARVAITGVVHHVRPDTLALFMPDRRALDAKDQAEPISALSP